MNNRVGPIRISQLASEGWGTLVPLKKISSRVYLVTDGSHDYYLKVRPLRISSAPEQVNTDDTEVSIHSFMCENGLAPPIYRHVSIGSHFVYMTPAVGSSLEELFPYEERDKNAILSDFMEKINAAIDRMHGLGVVHGDLGPTNIVIQDGKPLFIDFEYSFRKNQIPPGRIEYLNTFLGIDSEEPTLDQILDRERELYAQ